MSTTQQQPDIQRHNINDSSNSHSNLISNDRPQLNKQPSRSAIDIEQLQLQQQQSSPLSRSHNLPRIDTSSQRNSIAQPPISHAVTPSHAQHHHIVPHVSYQSAKSKILKALKYIGILNWLLLLFPVSLGLWSAKVSPIAQFITAAIAVIPAAGWLGDATEQLSDSLGPGLGGLMNATFGNAAELIISLFAMYKGEDDLVKASLVGSILGNLLLVLGCAILAGGIKYRVQTFSRNAAGVESNMAVVAAVAFLVPAIFNVATGNYMSNNEEQKLSLGISVILFVAYISFLIFQLKTHKDFMEQFDSLQESINHTPTSKNNKSIQIYYNITGKQDKHDKLYNNNKESDKPKLLPAKSLPLNNNNDNYNHDYNNNNTSNMTPRSNNTRDGRSTPNYPLPKIYARAGSLTSTHAVARQFLQHSQSFQQLPPKQRNINDSNSTNGNTFSNSLRDIFTAQSNDDQHNSALNDNNNNNSNDIRYRRPLSRSGTADERLQRRRPTLGTIAQARNENNNLHEESTDKLVPDRAQRSSDKPGDNTVDNDNDNNSDSGSVSGEGEEDEEKWSRKKACVVLLGATAVIAVLSEVLTDSVTEFGQAIGLGDIFIGVIIVAIVGNAAEHSTAILMALADNMDVAISIAFGSALQIAMFVMPVIVFFSYSRSSGPMDLLFSNFEVFGIAVAAILSWIVVQDGGSNYLEGVMLLIIYLILAIGFLFGPSSEAEAVQDILRYNTPQYCVLPSTAGGSTSAMRFVPCSTIGQ